MTFIGIVLPAVIAAMALRRWVVRVPWHIVALLLALTLAFLHGAVFTSKLPVPVDEVARGYPWHGLFPDVTEARNGLTNDTVKLFLPWMQVVREEFSHGRAPLWNRYSFSGSPLLANSESAPFSPFFVATLFVSLPKQIVAMAGLKIFFSLLFSYLLLRRECLRDGAAMFGACAFAFCTFETVYLYYSTTAVTALLPAAIYALLEASADPRRSRIVLVAIIVAALLANGHPESVLHVAIGSVVFLLFEARLTLRRWIGPIVGAIAGLLISAPAWVPVLEQVFYSTRFAQLRHASAQALPLSTLWSLFAPNHFGNPVHHDWHGVLNYSVFASSYAGVLPLALGAWALVARKTSRRDRMLTAIAALLFLIAMNWTFVGHAINTVPPFSFTANDKLRFVFVFIVAVVAARAIPLFAWVATVIVLADLFSYNTTFNALVKPKYFRPRLPIIDALRTHAPREPFRVVGRDWVFLPNASAQYGLEDVRGSDPMELASYAEFFRTFSVQEPGTDVKRVQDVDRAELDFLNVRFLLAEPDAQLGGKWRLLYRGADGTLFENTRAEARFFSTTAKIASITNDDPRIFSVNVIAPTAAMILSSEPNAPGWRATVDGHQAAIRPGTFISFEVPAGEHKASIRYRPRAFYWSLAAASSALAILTTYRRG